MIYMIYMDYMITLSDVWERPLNLIPYSIIPQKAKFMGPTWGPSGSCRPQVGPMLARWTLLSRSAFLHFLGGDLLVTSGFSSQKYINVENISISWHHHVTLCSLTVFPVLIYANMIPGPSIWAVLCHSAWLADWIWSTWWALVCK